MKSPLLKRATLILQPALHGMAAGPLAAAGVAFAGFAASASAADLTPRETPPAFTWSGLYVGFNSGYTWRESGAFNTYGVNHFESPGLVPRLWGGASAAGVGGSVSALLNGFFAGGQVGYNWQFDSPFVVGLEADLQGAGVRGGGGFTTAIPAAAAPFAAPTSVAVDRSLEYFGTVRGRFGYALTPTMMFYVTGGLAYGGVATSTTVRQSLTPSLFPSASAKSDYFNNRIGWTVGGGVESALTSDLSAKLEFLYYDLGGAHVAFPNSAPLVHTAVATGDQVSDDIFSSTRFNGFIVRAGLNYRFAGSRPSSNAASGFDAPQFIVAEKPAADGWRATILPYLWALGLNGTTTARGQTIGMNLSFFDLLSKVSTPPLEFGTRFEARNGPFTAYGDFFWSQLRASGSALALRTPFTGANLTADASGRLKFTVKAILEGGVGYELARWSNGGGSASFTAIDALAGFRYWNISANVSLDITGTLNVAALGLSQVGNLAVVKSGDLNWVDPLVGLRIRQQLSPGAEFQLKGDIGGFGVGSKISWQAFGGYAQNFEFAGLNCQGLIGYRALEVDYAKGSGLQQAGLNAVLHGPIAALGLRF